MLSFHWGEGNVVIFISNSLLFCVFKSAYWLDDKSNKHHFKVLEIPIVKVKITHLDCLSKELCRELPSLKFKEWEFFICKF